MVRIRAMAEADVPAVSRLLGASWRRTYAPLIGAERAASITDEVHAPARLVEELADPNCMAFVAEREDGTIAGYALATMDSDGEAMLDRLHVEDNNQGRGVGTDLLHAVLAAHAGLPSIALEVLEGNDRALDFYRKHGFEVVERRLNSHGAPGHASFIMRRQLPWN
jgi:ribosomal protein S18 acetylase RimI-like enzyme